jgi:hypothetical protein
MKHIAALLLPLILIFPVLGKPAANDAAKKTAVKETASIPVEEPSNKFFDISVYGTFAMPTGFLTKGLSYGGGAQAMITAKYDDLLFYGLSVGIYSMAGTSSTSIRSYVFFPVQAIAGVSYALGSIIQVQPYLGAGYNPGMSVKDSVKYIGDPVISAGVQFPLKLWYTCVPYVQYSWIPDTHHFTAILFAGIGVTL